MKFFEYCGLAVGLLALASANGNQQQVLNEDVHEVTVGTIISNEYTHFEWEGTSSLRTQIIWKGGEYPLLNWKCHSSSKNETLLDFDDIKTPTFLANIKTYKNMTFSSFKVLNVPLAAKAGFLDPEDWNAATSPPNALLGSRNFSSPSQITIPRIFVENNCSSPKVDCENNFPHRFKAISMSIKPLGFIEKGERVHMEVNGWQFKEGEVLKWYGLGIIFFGPGRVGRGRMGMEPWGEGKGINVLETKFTNGEGEDWLFAVDDLVVDFLDGDE